jgi:hypothetical protein
MTDEQFLLHSEIARQAFEAGDKSQLLLIAANCALLGRLLPAWARAAFVAAVMGNTMFGIKSWDQAFGPPQKKGTNLPAQRRKIILTVPILLAVQERSARGEPIDLDMFEAIGAELRPAVSGATVRDMYYRVQKRRQARTSKKI